MVELARTDVRHNPAATPEMRTFANIRLEDAERPVHDLLKRYGFSAPIPLHFADLSPEVKGFPHMKFSDWAKYLLDSRRLCQQLCGCSSFSKMQRVLGMFWHRFQQIEAEHEIFERARSGLIDLTRTIPIYSHSDEGRACKKEAVWLLSIHGCLGRGTRQYLSKGKHMAPLSRCQMGLNFAGHTMSTQFLLATMLREVSKRHPGVLQELLRLVAEDLQQLVETGVTSEDGLRHVYFCHLATKGDLPALKSMAGGVTRSFSNIPRAPRSRKACAGICPQCLAGREADDTAGWRAYPFEDLGAFPCWEPTIDQEDPWHTFPAIMHGQPINPTKRSLFFQFDLWHSVHLGIAKHFVASALVCVVESRLECMQGHRSVDSRLEWISDQYVAFCRAKKLSMWVTQIDREELNFPSSSACPCGKWNKGSASTALMLFLGEFCKLHIVHKTDDEVLLQIAPRFCAW